MNASTYNLSIKIKLLRKEKGLTQKDLAAEIGVDSKMISYYETGKSIPSVDALVKIAGIFNTSIDFLLFDKIEKIPATSQALSKNAKRGGLKIANGFKWQIIIILLIALSSLVSANMLIYNLTRKTHLSQSRKNINRIAEKINSRISNIKYASKIIANDQMVTGLNYDLSKNSGKQGLIMLNTVKSLFNASIVYIMDENGTVIACTPYDGGKTLTGKNFRFRPYFTEAMNNNPSVYAALGTTTLERGIYYSYPIYGKNNKEPNGVAVIKMGIHDIDKIIKEYPGISGVLSPDGVVFISNRNGWLYKTALPIEDYRLQKIQKSKQFANRKLEKLEPQLISDEINLKEGTYFLTKKEIILPGWKVFTLEKLKWHYPAGISLIASSLIISLTLILIYLIKVNLNKKILENQRDIAEKNLSESEIKYRTVFENTGTATITFGDDRIITMCNTKFEQLSGYPRKEIIGRMKWSDFAAKDDILRLEDYHLKRGTNEKVPGEYSFKFIDRNGNHRNIHAKVDIIKDSRIRVMSLLDLNFLKQQS